SSLVATQQSCGGLQQFCAGLQHSCVPLQHSCAPLQHSCAPLQHSCAGLQHSRAGLQQSCAPLQQSCAAPNANAVRATAMTNSATVAIIVFLFKALLLIGSEFMISAQNFARVAAFSISHTATRCCDGAKDERPQARALITLAMEDTTANWMRLRTSHPAR